MDKKITNAFLLIIVALTITVTGSLFFPIPVNAAGPELPRTFLNTNYPNLSSNRTIRTVKSTCGTTANCYTSLQKAIDEAVLGDEIVVDAGLMVTGPITLKEKTSGSGWIVIRTSDMGGIPQVGIRVSPSDASSMPKILASGKNVPAIIAADKAHHYRIVGVEIKEKTPDDDENILVELGTGKSYCATATSLYVVCTDQSVLNNYSHDIVLDRVYIHGDSTHNTKAGVGLNNKSSAIIDSYISDIHMAYNDAQAIIGAWGPGPYKIVNNYLEASGENLIFGGDDPRVENLIPSDIEIRNNYFYKPLSWRQGDPSFNGRKWVVKNLFELKNAQRVLVDGNVFENNWSESQPGTAILINATNQGGKCLWCAPMDVTFTNNVVKHSGAGVSFTGNDYHYPASTGRTQRVKVSNNLFLDLSGSKWKNLSTGTNAASYLFYLPSGSAEPGPDDVEISNNTAFHSGNLVTLDTDKGGFQKKTGFIFKNNIVAHNSYGIFGQGTSGFDGPSLDAYTPGAVFTNNVIVGQRSATDARDWSGNFKNYPGNYFPKSWSDVGFTDFNGENFKLSNSSLYKNAGTNGKDIGVDFDALNSAIANVAQGSASSAYTPPTRSVSASNSETQAPVQPAPTTPAVTTAARTSGGGGGGGSSSGSSGNSVEALRARLVELLSQLAAMGGTVPSSVSSTAVGSTSFTSDLTLGSTGPQVTALQQMLVNQGFLVMPPGVAYGYFGTLTQVAVANWQRSKGITPASGYFGPISRSRVQ